MLAIADWLLLPPLAYQLLAAVAAVRHLRQRWRTSSHSSFQPPVSVLKPVRGLDPNTGEAFLSQLQQDYPTFEVLFGAHDADDPAAAEVRRLQTKFPAAPLRLIIGSADAANAKVGTLINLAQHARYPIWIVNDSDIKVTPIYLRQIVAPLADLAIAVVTCPYRVKAHNIAAAWEALGISTDFMPSTLVAQLLGVREFGLGSTIAFRSADLERAGGFAALADYLADDYQLAKRITAQGGRALLSTYTVETALVGSTWRGIWQHQLRWARTIRASKGRGYAGLPITHAGVWILAALMAGNWFPATFLLLISRILSAFCTGWFVLRSPLAAAFCWLSPVWDLYAFCVWLSSYSGRQVRWRDRVLSIGADGRIENPK